MFSRVSPTVLPTLSSFELAENPERAEQEPGYVTDVIARFSGIPALDTKTRERVPVDYFVAGDLYRDGDTLRLERTWVLAVDEQDDPIDTGYRFRPGIDNTVGMARALANRVHDAYPEARTLEIAGRRGTDGFVGRRNQRVRLELGGA